MKPIDKKKPSGSKYEKPEITMVVPFQVSFNWFGNPLMFFGTDPAVDNTDPSADGPSTGCC